MVQIGKMRETAYRSVYESARTSFTILIYANTFRPRISYQPYQPDITSKVSPISPGLVTRGPLSERSSRTGMSVSDRSTRLVSRLRPWRSHVRHVTKGTRGRVDEFETRLGDTAASGKHRPRHPVNLRSRNNCLSSLRSSLLSPYRFLFLPIPSLLPSPLPLFLSTSCCSPLPFSSLPDRGRENAGRNRFVLIRALAKRECAPLRRGAQIPREAK